MEQPAGVGVGERLGFEINHEQAAERAVKEQQVHAIPLAADAQAALASDEGEVAAEFEEEGFEVADVRRDAEPNDTFTASSKPVRQDNRPGPTTRELPWLDARFDRPRAIDSPLHDI